MGDRLRRMLRRSRGGDVGEASWQREVGDGFELLRAEIRVPTRRTAPALREVAAAAARAAMSAGPTVGSVAVVPGEEPVLLAFAGSLPALAERVHAALREGPGRQRRTLWLSLAGGAYLADAVDPYAPFAGSDGDLRVLVTGRAVEQVVVSHVVWTRTAAVVEVAVAAAPGRGRHVLRLLRRGLAPLGPWRRSSRSDDAAPRTALNSSPQR